MLTLALDTTTRAGSVAVVREAGVLSIVEGDGSRTHGERLPGEIDLALTRAGVTPADLHLLAVASGPGAFTGLRIGIAAIQGIAMVLRIPVIAVSALDALALSVIASGRTEPIAAWMDAQRGEVFAAYYDGAQHDDGTPTPSAVPVAATPDVVLAGIPGESGAIFVGDGAARYRAQILTAAGGVHQVAPPPDALAPYIATIGMRRARHGGAGQPHALQPLYVRRPDAELERHRRETR